MILPRVILCVSLPLDPLLVQVVVPILILLIARPALLASFHVKFIVTSPLPSNLLPSAENLTFPLSIVKDALVSVP